MARRWAFPPLRLRHKLAISLSVAALLPVVVASWVAVSVVFRSLSVGVTDEAAGKLEVGLNLLLRNVERLGHFAVQLSTRPELSEAIEGDRQAIIEAIRGEEPHLPASLVQVADAQGKLRAHQVIGRAHSRFSGLGVAAGDPVLEAGLKYERRVTFTPVEDELVVRASAPIVDEDYNLRGAVVLSMPLDSHFADGLKGALGTDVLIFAGKDVGSGRPGPGMSTFLDREGARVEGLDVPPAAARMVAEGRMTFSAEKIRERHYTIAYGPLYDIAGGVVGVFAVAVDRAELVSARTAATRSLALGAAGAFIFAIGLAGLLSRRITRPIAKLHQGAIAIARGDLEHEMEVAEGDEIGDLATAFAKMTDALKVNQRRLAARMREIVALHDAGRAVSSVIDHDLVLRKIVDQVARVLNARVVAIWLAEDGKVRLGAVRAKKVDLRTTMHDQEGVELARSLSGVAQRVVSSGHSLRIDDTSISELTGPARGVGISGSMMAVPLERKGAAIGVVVAARQAETNNFSDADNNLLATFADQAAAAIDNARLYQEVRNFNEELEAKVRQRTSELIESNRELERAINELGETQAQLVLSERLAGLGQLVAGVAHEINSPSAAIAGTIDAFDASVAKLTELAPQLAHLPLTDDDWAYFFELADEAAGALSNRMIPSPSLVRRTAKQLRSRLEGRGVGPDMASEVSRALADLVPEPELLTRLADALVPEGAEVGDLKQRIKLLLGYFRAYVYLHRGAHTIKSAIRRIQRIVGGLKSYSHLDQQARTEADLHEGIDNTLVILEHLLGKGGIQVLRKYGDLPPVTAFVDELNQVWTNLLHNAVQALGGSGNITIETLTEGSDVVVRIIDDGPGIPSESLDKIFEPFYTTKPKGEGTGLGLRIVKQIVEKHHGSISVSSQPGRTCFEVRLPVEATEVSTGVAS